MSKQAHSNEVKAAVLAALLTGQSVSSVAREYEIPKGTVSKWKHQAGSPAKPGVATQKEIGDLLTEYLSAGLRCLRLQADAFSDREWLAKQSAQELAVLHGVMADKAVRLLEAFGREEGDGDA